MSEDEFVATFADLVDGAPWLIRAAYAARPFGDAYALRGAFHDALLTGAGEDQLGLLRSLPDLGSEDAPDLTYVRDHSEAGVGALVAEDHDSLQELAATYRERFGFPLIVSARDVDRYDKVVDGGWARMANSAAAERAAALIEVAKILNHRFDEKVADANPIASARVKRAAEIAH